MNRLEEIKERLEHVSTKRGVELYHARNAFDTHSEADVDYLLQRLEITQKALEHYADIELYKGIQQGELFADWFMRQNHVAVQALEKIKEP